MRFPLVKQIFSAVLLGSAAVLSADEGQLSNIQKSVASGIDNSGGAFGGGLNFSRIRSVKASANVYEYIGDNLIARGNVRVQAKGIFLTADKAIINLKSQDFEAFGNVQFVSEETTEMTVNHKEYRKLLDSLDTQVTVLYLTTNPAGRPLLKVRIRKKATRMQAERISGNMLSGRFALRNIGLRSGALNMVAQEGIRHPDGKIELKNSKVTTCDHLLDAREHYSFTSSHTTVIPRHYESGLRNYSTDKGEHTVILYNPVARVYDVPVFWAPILVKPWETDTFGIDLRFGKSSDWGWFFKASKGFTLKDDPYFHVDAMLDWYTDRGIGWGAGAKLITGNSNTELFIYGIRDKNPYYSWTVTDDREAQLFANGTRLAIPKNRYDFKLTNVTHITPKLDFRGQFEMLSDYYFLKAYFENRYDQSTQPPTYAGLEYEFDYASLSLYGRFRPNSFDNTVQRLPEINFTVPRFELFGGLYYQGENQFTYNKMKFRQFDKDIPGGDAEDYDAARFDTLHFLYYPLDLSFLHIVPRAGFRLTAWSHSSKNEMSDEDINRLFYVNSIESGYFTGAYKNFHKTNSSVVRFMAEFGVDVNTKIYRTWNDVRVPWAGLDGLRHVAIPFISYTYIPKPTGDTKNVLYFDNIDRLEKQHFIRTGLTNRIETRNGAFGSEQIRQWAEVTAYFDYHLEKTENYSNNQDFSNLGDLTLKLKLSPTDDLTLSTELVWDIGKSNDHESEAVRGDRSAGRPGLSQLKYLNRWNTYLTYRFAQDFSISFNYTYQDTYVGRPTYSMGSTLDAVTTMATGMCSRYVRGQTFNSTLRFPTYIDPTLKGSIYISYDVDAALMQDLILSLEKQFHCIDIGLSVGTTVSRDSDGDKKRSNFIAGSIRLHAMPGVGYSLKHK